MSAYTPPDKIEIYAASRGDDDAIHEAEIDLHRLQHIESAALLALGLLWMTERHSPKAQEAFRVLRNSLGGKNALRKGGSVNLIGFGSFQIGKRAARTGRHPHDGRPVNIRARKVPKFKASKVLKDALNRWP